MQWNRMIFWVFICTLLSVFGSREVFEAKCKRDCNTVEGTLECWKETTDGFAYGLATTMIDFCQVVLKLRNLTNDKESWYNISRDILTKQIEQYELEGGIRQLTKENIKQMAVSLLDKCFNASSSITSFEPSCPSCSIRQTKLIHQWRLSSIIVLSIALLLILIIFLLYSLHTHYVRRSYVLL